MSGNNQTRSDEIELLASVNEDSVVKLLQDVLQIESTNPPGNEIHLARYLADFFNDVGLNPVLLEYEDNHANLVVRIKGSADQAGLIFSAHMDTVPAGKVPWKFPPFSGAIHEGRIYGRGHFFPC